MRRLALLAGTAVAAVAVACATPQTGESLPRHSAVTAADTASVTTATPTPTATPTGSAGWQ
ncbi:hypothetical protein [Streptomyces sp. NPDC056361]|uniref:hypothetical protein n=1 Tax=Streptomyces sp. NPDC056361 TaxID=3345795 RepID=UPI0035DB2D45